MPASRRAVSAVPGVRKWKSLGAGSPRVVIAVSRFTMARSARRSPGAAGPNAVAGCASRAAVRSVKCTSPANANVNSPDGRAGVEEAGWAEEGRAAARAAEDVDDGGPDVGSAGCALPLVQAAAATATQAIRAICGRAARGIA